MNRRYTKMNTISTGREAITNTGRDRRPVPGAHPSRSGGEKHGQGAGLPRSREGHRQQVVAPRQYELGQAGDDQPVAGQRNTHMPKPPERRRAVHFRRFHQFLWYQLEGALHDKEAHRQPEGRIGRDQPENRVQEIQLALDRPHTDDAGDTNRDQQRREGSDDHHRLRSEAEMHDRVGQQARRGDGQGDASHRHDGAVEEVASQGADRPPGLPVVLQRQAETRDDLVGVGIREGLDRQQQHPEQRQRHEQHQQDQVSVRRHPSENGPQVPAVRCPCANRRHERVSLPTRSISTIRASTANVPISPTAEA